MYFQYHREHCYKCYEHWMKATEDEDNSEQQLGMLSCTCLLYIMDDGQ